MTVYHYESSPNNAHERRPERAGEKNGLLFCQVSVAPARSGALCAALGRYMIHEND